MGLGSLAEGSLKEARAAAEQWRKVAPSGHDPIRERERLKREAAAQQGGDQRRDDVADDGAEGMRERPHGFRSRFRDWCAKATSTPREVAEAALAHIDGTKGERAYRRTEFLEQRRPLMERWAGFVTGRGADVLPLKAGA
jgi:hypothetical protein